MAKLKTFAFSLPLDLKQRINSFYDFKAKELPGISMSKVVCFLIDAGLKSVGF